MSSIKSKPPKINALHIRSGLRSGFDEKKCRKCVDSCAEKAMESMLTTDYLTCLDKCKRTACY